VVFEETGTQVAAVDALRRRLWSEHLGYPSPAASELTDAPGTDWLAVWQQRAGAKRDGLTQNLDDVSSIRVLEWPAPAFEDSLGICRLLKLHHKHATAAAYLRSLLSPDEVPGDVLVSQFNVLGEDGPPSFEFHYDSAPSSGSGPRT
jgi:hypothetical protein